MSQQLYETNLSIGESPSAPMIGSETINRPIVSGWWWTRPASDCAWRIVEITVVDGRIWIQEMGDEEPDVLGEPPWWEWIGPLAQPKSQNTERSDPPRVR